MFLHVSASHIVYCLNLAFGPGRKNDISGYILPRSFIQMVKCSLLDEKILYQSFYGAPLTLSYFFTSWKSSVFCTREQVACEMFISKAFQRPCRKNLQLNLTQIVHSNSKMLFLFQLIVYQSFYGALLAFSYFLL